MHCNSNIENPAPIKLDMWCVKQLFPSPYWWLLYFRLDFHSFFLFCHFFCPLFLGFLAIFWYFWYVFDSFFSHFLSTFGRLFKYFLVHFLINIWLTLLATFCLLYWLLYLQFMQAWQILANFLVSKCNLLPIVTQQEKRDLHLVKIKNIPWNWS